MALIVLIAPNEEIAKVAIIAKQKYGLDMDIHIGTMDESVEIAKKLIKEGTKVFISRGGTAILIRNKLNEQVVEIKMVLDDAVCAISEAKKHGNYIRFLAFSNQLQGFDSLGSLMGLKIEQYLINDWTEIERKVLEAKNDGVEVLIGGAWPIAVTKKVGLPSVFLSSSESAIYLAYCDAKNMLDVLLNNERREKEIYTILDYSGDGFVAIDKNGCITLANDFICKVFGINTDDVLGTYIEKTFPIIANLVEALNVDNLSSDVITINNLTILFNRISLINEDKIVGAMGTLKDIKNVHEEDKRISYKQYKKGLFAKYNFSDISGVSDAISDTKKIARSFAKTDATVLITSESGTGKELFAQSIHNYSARANGPFIAVSCASLAESILESELFGYVDGAFTGANKNGKMGLFEMADHGTIFLDEIGEVPLKLQGILLRVIQERCIRRLGDDRIIPIDVRIIAATNRNLVNDIQDGCFRKDLFFRLNVLHLTISPLRERREDIIVLAIEFLRKYGNNSDFILSDRDKHLLMEYNWPGNVRELENLMEKISIIGLEKTIEEILKEHISEFNYLPNTDKVNLYYEEVKRILDYTNGNKTKAANLLGVHRSTLWRYLNKN